MWTLEEHSQLNAAKLFSPSLETGSLWTVKSDADGNVLQRHETDDLADPRDSKRVRFTHKELVKLADMEITDDTFPNHAKWPEPQSSSFFQKPSGSTSSRAKPFASRKHFIQRTRALRRRHALMSVWTIA